MALPEITYLFIDGGHIRKYYREFAQSWSASDGEIDFQGLRSLFKPYKIFYYDCLDTIINKAETSADFDRRKDSQEEELDRIRALSGSHVRLGRIEGTTERKRRQKEVDILLAVDMMNHAIRKNMSKAILVAGDGDYRPLVSSLIDLGIFVEVVGDEKHTAKELRRAADYFQGITFLHYHSWSSEEFKKVYPLPSTGSYNLGNVKVLPGADDAIKRGKFGFEDVIVLQRMTQFVLRVTDKKHGIYSDIGPTSLDRAELYFNLRYGKIEWE